MTPEKRKDEKPLEQSMREEIGRLEEAVKRGFKIKMSGDYKKDLKIVSAFAGTLGNLQTAKSDFQKLQSARRRLENKLKFVTDDDEIEIDSKGRLRKHISVQEALSLVREVLGGDKDKEG